MSDSELELLRTMAGDPRHMERLAERITRSIGNAPRRLPSRTTLAIEGMARQLSVIASAAAIAMLILGAFARNTAGDEGPSLAARILEGKLTRAEDVYVTMTGISTKTALEP